MRGQATGSRFRQRKLSTKQALSILKESDLEPQPVDDFASIERNDSLTSLPKVESGVESKEEREHHLQQVINAARVAATGGSAQAAAAALSIPTPDVGPSSVRYDQLYQPIFQQPHTYIRFSSTVEDCIGVPYCINDEDDVFLKTFNAKRAANAQCTEDEFEQLMSSYEETTAVRQPFAALDNTPVLALDEMEASFDETVSERARKCAEEAYEYWKSERVKHGNKSLMPKLKTLKMDSAGADADDNDPYVCFRRREVRQVRKTRGRDALVVEKLKKLRKELEEGRHLLHLVKEREYGRKDDLSLSRHIFDQRASVRELKRTHSIVDDDEDLLTQRTPKRRPQDMPQNQPRGPSVSRLPGRPDAAGVTAPEADLVNFREVVNARDREVARNININVTSHERWNRDFIDRTEEQLRAIFAPADLVLDSDSEEVMPSFVGVKAEYIQQPTPPASVIADSNDEDDEGLESTPVAGEKVPVRYARMSEYKSFKGEAHMRRRTGRGGRMMVDRRLPRKLSREDVDEKTFDRFKYDHDDGDASEDDDVDIYSRMGFHLRAYWSMRQLQSERDSAALAAKRAQQQQQAVQQQTQKSGAGQSSNTGQSSAS